eukprot:gene25684-biopygen10763
MRFDSIVTALSQTDHRAVHTWDRQLQFQFDSGKSNLSKIDENHHFGGKTTDEGTNASRKRQRRQIKTHPQIHSSDIMGIVLVLLTTPVGELCWSDAFYQMQSQRYYPNNGASCKKHFPRIPPAPRFRKLGWTKKPPLQTWLETPGKLGLM